MQPPHLGLLVQAERHARLVGLFETLLHLGHVEQVLIKDLAQHAELVGVGERLVFFEPVHVAGSWLLLVGAVWRQEDALHDRAAMIIAVRSEPVHDAIKRTPGMEVGEQRVVQAVHHLGVAHAVDHVAGHLSPPLTSSGRADGSHRRLFVDGEGKVLVLANVHHGSHHDLLCRHIVAQVGARRATRGDDPREVVPHIDLAVGVAQVIHDLGVGRVYVVRLAERFLRDLPVGVNDLGHVGLLIPPLEIPHLEVVVHLANEVGQWLGVRIGIDEHEASPHARLGLGEFELFGLDMREVPLRRDVLQVAVDRPRKPMKRTSDLGAVPVVVLELTAPMQTSVRVGPNVTLDPAHDDVARTSNLVQVVVAGLGNLIGSARVLPNLRPQISLLRLVVLAAGVALFAEVLCALVVRRFQSKNVRHRMRVGIQQFLIRDADVVMFVFREEYYVARSEPSEGTEEHNKWMEEMERLHGKAEIIVGKQRHGPIGTIKLAFNPELTKFGNLAPEDDFSGGY